MDQRNSLLGGTRKNGTPGDIDRNRYEEMDCTSISSDAVFRKIYDNGKPEEMNLAKVLLQEQRMMMIRHSFHENYKNTS